MEANKQIIYDDPIAARFVENIKGWVDINNRFYGNNPDSEHMARWSSCTHKKCQCGNVTTKGWKLCEECRTKVEIELYNKMPFEEYKGEMVYSHYADKYFRDSSEIEDYCEEEEVEHKDLKLVFCQGNFFKQIDSDYWEDILPEDSEGVFPDKLKDALDFLNKIISELAPASYSPVSIRTEYKPIGLLSISSKNYGEDGVGLTSEQITDLI